jgi:hypothetical protein
MEFLTGTPSKQSEQQPQRHEDFAALLGSSLIVNV